MNDPTHWATPYTHETARLTLFPCDTPAAQELARIVRDPRVFVSYYIESLSRWNDSPEVWLQNSDGWQIDGRFNLAVRLRQDGQIVGCVQFAARHFSYFVQPEYWRYGIGHEMVQAACSYLPPLLDIRRLQTKVLRENLASRRILEKAGFGFTGMGYESWNGGGGKLAVLNYVRHL